MNKREPVPFAAALVLLPVLAVWTAPQTLAGLAFALLWRARGVTGSWYRFGWFVFWVVPRRPPMASGISLGIVVLADNPAVLTHEFCHLYTGLWLSWLYLPVYGIEYLCFGHDGSPHERLTVRFERETRLVWRRLGNKGLMGNGSLE